MATNPLPTPPDTLTIDLVTSTDGLPTLVCRGRITVETAAQFKLEVKRLAPEHHYVMADLSEVEYVDSSGLGEVLAAYLSAKSAGCELRLVKVHPRVKDLLDMTRLAKVFDAN